MADEETLSDHKYIVIEILLTLRSRVRGSVSAIPQWALKHMDENAAKAAAIAKAWEESLELE